MISPFPKPPSWVTLAVLPLIGQNINYVITVTNTGVNDAMGVVITDNLPGNVVFVSALADRGSYDDGSGLWTVGDVYNGESLTLTISGTVNGVPYASIINSAEVTAMNQPDIDSVPGNSDPAEDDYAEVSLYTCPATNWAIADGDVGMLVAAIEAARNTTCHLSAPTITLAANGTYNLGGQ
jgi:uncharacterized repeat protein (TIGR01451 family)